MPSTRTIGRALPPDTRHGFAPVRKSGWGIIALLLGISCTGVGEPPRSEILFATEPMMGGAGGAQGISTRLIFSLDIWSAATAPGPVGCRESGVAIFYQNTIRDGDDHHTLVADAGNEPDFAAFAHLLTDGVDDQVALCVTLENLGGGGTGNSESRFFVGRPGTAPDFAGYTIDRVEFQIDSVSIAPTDCSACRDGIWTDYYLAGRLVVWGRR